MCHQQRTQRMLLSSGLSYSWARTLHVRASSWRWLKHFKRRTHQHTAAQQMMMMMMMLMRMLAVVIMRSGISWWPLIGFVVHGSCTFRRTGFPLSRRHLGFSVRSVRPLHATTHEHIKSCIKRWSVLIVVGLGGRATRRWDQLVDVRPYSWHDADALG